MIKQRDAVKTVKKTVRTKAVVRDKKRDFRNKYFVHNINPYPANVENMVSS